MKRAYHPGGVLTITLNSDSGPYSAEYYVPPRRGESIVDALKRIFSSARFACPFYANCPCWNSARCYDSNNTRRFSDMPICRKRLIQRVRGVNKARKKVRK